MEKSDILLRYIKGYIVSDDELEFLCTTDYIPFTGNVFRGEASNNDYDYEENIKSWSINPMVAKYFSEYKKGTYKILFIGYIENGIDVIKTLDKWNVIVSGLANLESEVLGVVKKESIIKTFLN